MIDADAGELYAAWRGAEARIRVALGWAEQVQHGGFPFEQMVAALTEQQQPVREADVCKYPGCPDRFMTTHHVTDCYFDTDPDNDPTWPMLHASATTDKIHIHAVWCRHLPDPTSQPTRERESQ